VQSLAPVLHEDLLVGSDSFLFELRLHSFGHDMGESSLGVEGTSGKVETAILVESCKFAQIITDDGLALAHFAGIVVLVFVEELDFLIDQFQVFFIDNKAVRVFAPELLVMDGRPLEVRLLNLLLPLIKAAEFLVVLFEGSL